MSSEVSASDCIPFQDLQEKELASVFAKFPDVHDLRTKDVSNAWHPVELQVTVKSEENRSMIQETAVDLYVEYAADYPTSLPIIDIRNVKGISAEFVSKLKANLINLAKQHIGKEIILNLVSETKTFLHAYLDHQQFKSLSKEMVLNQQESHDTVVGEKTNCIDRCGQDSSQEDFVECKAAVLDNLEADDSLPLVFKPDSYDSVVEEERCVFDCDVVFCNYRRRLHLKSSDRDVIFLRERCLGHNRRGCTTSLERNLKTGKLAIVTAWPLTLLFFRKPGTEEYKIFEKKIIDHLEDIQQTVRLLSKIKYNHLVHYMDMIYMKKDGTIIVYVVQEYVQGISLFERRGAILIDELKFYCRAILRSLYCLHLNSVVHQNLRSTSVFLDHGGSVQLADYSIDKRLHDLYRWCNKPLGWKMNLLPVERYSEKDDVHQLGVLLLNLYLGSIPKNTENVIPQSLNSVFRDFLQRCLSQNQEYRWSAEKLLTHPFVWLIRMPNVMPESDTTQEESGYDIITPTCIMRS